jgi:ABC-2 type transport system ATP-binding protein
MLKVENLTKTYGEQIAVNHISFEVAKGEIVGFLGPNGAGKSSTMKMITCFLPPTSGNVLIEDKYSILENPMEVKKRIGYLPEHNPLYLDMYVKEFLIFAAKVYQIPPKEQEKRVHEMIEITGLTPEKHKKIGQLSKGYRQRVGLAQALIHDPEILILDEPTTGLDPNQIIEIRNLILELGKSKTIIFSSHILSEVEAIADRILIIHKGNLLINDTKARLQSLGENENIFKLEVEKPGLNLEALQHLEGFISISQTSPTSFYIKSQKNLDLRKIIFEQCQEQDNPILSLNKESMNLEAIFKKMTNN